MPRVHHVKKARKDNPAVSKGQPYYHWQRYRSRKQYSATYPKRSQLTSSGKLATIYDAEDNVGNFAIDSSDRDCLLMSLQGFEGAVREAGESFREVGEEYNESADNLEEYFSGSQQIDDIREKAEACETAADDADTLADELSDTHERLVDLGDEPTEDAPGDDLEKPSEVDYDDAEDPEEAWQEAFEAWQVAVSDAADEWQTEFDDIANDADNHGSEFEGPQF